MKNKNTILYDFLKIAHSINCDSLYCNCNDCSNKKLCDTVEDVIKSIGDLYIFIKSSSKVLFILSPLII